MDVDPLALTEPAAEDLPDEALLVKGLPQLSIPCATITVTSKYVLKKAAKKLAVSIHGYEFASLGGDDVTASVTMDVPPHRGSPVMKKQVFYGEWTRFHSQAKESACLAALTYLKKEGLIEVHDTNYKELTECKRKYETERFWSTELCDRARSLKKQLGEKAIAGNFTIAHGTYSPPMGLTAEVHGATPPPSMVETAVSVNQMQAKHQDRHSARRSLFMKD